MWKLSASAALAVTTILGGAAWGQETMTGEFSPSSPVYDAVECSGVPPSCSFFAGGVAYESFQVTIQDGAGYSIGGTLGTTTFIYYTLYSNFDLANTAANVVAYGNPISQGPLSGATFTLSPGQYVLVVDDGVSFVDGTFVVSLMGAVFGWGPTVAEELGNFLAVSGGAARLVVVDAQGVARDLGAASLVARDAQQSPSRIAPPGDDLVQSSKSATAGLVGNVYSWAQITGFDSNAESGPGSISGTGFQIGADLAIGPDMVAGLSLGHSEISATDTASSQDGSLTYLQPYFSYRSGKWHGNASLIYGRGTFDQVSVGGAGTGKTELLALTFEGGYDIALKNGITFTPMIGLIHGRENVEGTGGTLAGDGTQHYDFSQASVGARFSSRRAGGTFFAGLHADYLDQDAGGVLTSAFLSEDGWTGRIEIGGSTELNNGLGLSTAIDISGLGGSAQTVSGGLRVSLRF
jgi:Autotransporter beta-domain